MSDWTKRPTSLQLMNNEIWKLKAELKEAKAEINRLTLENSLLVTGGDVFVKKYQQLVEGLRKIIGGNFYDWDKVEMIQDVLNAIPTTHTEQQPKTD